MNTTPAAAHLSDTTTRTAGDLAVGDVMVVILMKTVHRTVDTVTPKTVHCTVDTVTPTGSYKMGTRVPMVRITYTDAPRSIKAIEVAADQLVTILVPARDALAAAEALRTEWVATIARADAALARAYAAVDAAYAALADVEANHPDTLARIINADHAEALEINTWIMYCRHCEKRVDSRIRCWTAGGPTPEQAAIDAERAQLTPAELAYADAQRGYWA